MASLDSRRARAAPAPLSEKMTVRSIAAKMVHGSVSSMILWRRERRRCVSYVAGGSSKSRARIETGLRPRGARGDELEGNASARRGRPSFYGSTLFFCT